ncbi:MAG: hypothetical protein GF418_09425 [Chitinivibrionales bacterium]|nr:hypothetical protein [Chitinivibrionales bacterium]MBD3395829.1 hypothetical protein [Chitinivibrionales bacterium]
MRCHLETVLVDCLRDTLHVMLCSGSSETVRAVGRSLKQGALFSLFKAKSPQTMEELLGQVHAWHVVVIDEQCQFAPDFLALARGCRGWLPVIALTNSWSIKSISSARPASGADMAGESAGGGLQIEVIEEQPVATCPISNPRQLLHHVQEWSIKRKLVSKPLNGLAAKAMDILFRENPLSVDDWSSVLAVKPRRFQREFKLFTDLSPKKILALYHAYRIAFSVVDEHNNREKGVISAYLVNDRARERVMEYVLTHRSALLTATN